MLIVALTAAVGLCVVPPALAERIVPANGSVDGQIIFQINPSEDNPIGIQVWDGQGVGTFLGDHVNRGVTFFTADGSVTGVFKAVAADGSTVSGTYVGSFAPIPGTPDVAFTVRTTWQSGTGRLEGVSGGADVIAIVDGETGALHYDYVGEWILP